MAFTMIMSAVNGNLLRRVLIHIVGKYIFSVIYKKKHVYRIM